MKRKYFLVIGLLVLLAATTATVVSAAGQNEAGKLRAATRQFRDVETAQAAGYDLVPGLDYCFENPGVGGMGYHYINVNLLDVTLDPSQPEAMVYSTRPNGELGLGAVEYIVPADQWDAAGNTEPPFVLGRHLHLNEDLGVYVLHAWIWKSNPSGLFEDWNPRVSCP